jgi:membrane-bound lytic murein transglycosylase D
MKLFGISLVGLLFVMSPGLFSCSAKAVTSEEQGVAPVVTKMESRPWRPPTYGEQGSPLGYSADVFRTPKGMEKQVQFWIDIYSKYSTDQGVIHDAEDVEKIYSVVDFSGLKTDREKQKKIDEEKKAISKNLNKAEQDRLRFQLGQKDRMRDAIYFSGRYLEEMEQIFKETDLPIELTRLVFVESSFNILARSKVGASGIWQIMPYTARPYMMMTSSVDKRNHPMEATKFAAKLLRQNYNLLESWPLAVTGYNHGPTGVLKMTRSYKTRELASLVQNVTSRASFGFASRNFYACFLAALEVEKNAAKYFESVVWSKPLDLKEFRLPVAIKYKDVLNWFDGDDSKVQIFNPHLTQKARKGHAIPARTLIAVPRDKYQLAINSLGVKDRKLAMEEGKRAK